MITLRRKLSYQIACLILCLLVVGTAALWGLEGLRSDFSTALDGYRRLRDLYEVGTHVEKAQLLISISHPEPDRALHELQQALGLFDLDFPVAAARDDRAMRESVRDALSAAVKSAQSPGGLDSSDFNEILKPIADLDVHNRQTIQDAQNRADRKRTVTLMGMSCLLAAMAIGAGIVGASQYRSIMLPLARLRTAVQRIASGRFTERVPAGPTTEFAQLAGHFNQMAAELEGLYRDLQEKVDAKSRELVRNERLASVGFLAAGVAHEINNPLGIITAHAELSLESLKSANAALTGECARSLSIIYEEAFRCKKIVEKLLTLARGPLEPMVVFSVGPVIQEVAAMVLGMPEYRDRQLVIADGAQTGGGSSAPISKDNSGNSSDAADRITGRPGEIKQILLNLLFNAVEAAPPGGEVRVDLACDARTVEISISDTGRGMTAEMLERIFEPFYTDPRGKASAGVRGTGLGLSITHAIVTRHDGQIRAFSDGPERGSRFVVIFPKANA